MKDPRFLGDLLDLPKRYQDSMKALASFPKQKGTASDVANVTKKSRAVESQNLNILVLMRNLRKDRQGRKVFFQIIIRGHNK